MTEIQTLENETTRSDRRVLLLTDVTKCLECDGSGQYVGLAHVEKCRICEGTGLVSEELPVV